ncbi:hypothetical protein CR103_00745 [Massilia psychrophila]|uniref:Uncharacterized protein n=1 Tax=Massilia psychrophila TaxID=1603353 RepID=A0A2G8T6L0_9BURK|nr:hypothetical protein CR103_00745 [Massilia psychrophila]
MATGARLLDKRRHVGHAVNGVVDAGERGERLRGAVARLGCPQPVEERNHQPNRPPLQRAKSGLADQRTEVFGQALPSMHQRLIARIVE